MFGVICMTDNFFDFLLCHALLFCTFAFFLSFQISHTYSREVADHGAIAPSLGKSYNIINGIIFSKKNLSS
jgi:hypothetical protein